MNLIIVLLSDSTFVGLTNFTKLKGLNEKIPRNRTTVLGYVIRNKESFPFRP